MTRHREALVVGAVLVAIQVIMFAGYYRGTATPSGDFLASYNTEAFAWWKDGGIWAPPDWVPYTWGGFPAAAQIQNSSWYLPVGLAAALVPYDIHAAAVVQALHLAVAGLGAYLLVRRAGIGLAGSLTALVGYSYTTGFFSGAPYVDIVRGFALLPWVLLCLSPLWPWRRWWAVPAAALVFWQAAVGVYPGVLVSVGYAGAAWALAWWVAAGRLGRGYVGPMVAAGVLGVVLGAVKYLPQLSLNSTHRGSPEDLTVLTRATLGSIVLPPYPGMPGIYSLNLLFVPATVVVAVFLASPRQRLVRIALVTAVVAAVLVPSQGPLAHLTGLLPGVGLSRFRLNDAYPVLALMAVLVAACGVHHALHPEGTQSRAGRAARGVALALPLLVAIAALTTGTFARAHWLPTFAVLVAATAAGTVAAARGVRPWRAGARTAATAVVVTLTAASGIAHSATVADLWRVDAHSAQVALWGATSGELIDQRVVQAGVRRPARTGSEATSTLGSPSLLAGFYTGAASMASSFTVHQSAAYVEASRAIADPRTSRSARTFWSAEGLLVAPAADGGLPDPATSVACAADGTCGVGLSVLPVQYAPGRLTYQVTTEKATAVLANEAYYPGWHVRLTDAEGAATQVVPVLGPAGSVQFEIPPGRWRVSLAYLTPLAGTSRAFFLAGLAGMALAAALGLRRRARYEPGEPTPMVGTATDPAVQA